MIRYFIYAILLYILLPVNATVDLIAMLVFFVALKENETTALLFAFLAGLLIDLYYPVLFGINMLVYTVLVQAVLYLKRYFAQGPLILLVVFAAFYLARNLVMYVFVAPIWHIQLLILTIALFLPVFLILNKTLHGIWMKT